MRRWQSFIQGFSQEIKAFIFFSLCLTVFRIIFLIKFQSQLATVSAGDILTSLWLGFRLSLKTVGAINLAGVIFCITPQVICYKWPADSIRKVLYSIITVILTVLFFGRIPFYTIFNSSYNIMLINGTYDDKWAIINTAVNEYHAIPYLIGAIVTGLILSAVLIKVLNIGTVDWTPKTKSAKWITAVVGCIIFVTICVGFRFGGAFKYSKSIHWENAARLNSNLLNETVLDDVQALYRVKSIARRIHEIQHINLSSEELRERIRNIGGNGDSRNFDTAFTRTVTEQRLSEPPQSITVILGESYGLWPFLEEFKEPGSYIVEQGRKYQSASNAMHTQYALAQGTGTMPAINGLLTGMPDTGLYPNYESESFKQSYGLGIGPVMKRMGYKTVFWYGGFSTWQNIKSFVLSQGFDEFHDASEIPAQESNAWGAPDKDLFDAINRYMDQHRGEKILNVVMTTSNHPPYTVNVTEEGFDVTKVQNRLPDTIADTPNKINELGHIWYADHVMGQYIEYEQSQDPSAIFVITGDHSERFSFVREEGPKVVSTIPIIFYGKGIHKEWLPDNAFGMSIQITPTLAELVGSPGQTYESMVPSLFHRDQFVFNHRLWMDEKGIYLQNKDMPGNFKRHMDIMRELAAWRIRNGNLIK